MKMKSNEIIIMCIMKHINIRRLCLVSLILSLPIRTMAQQTLSLEQVRQQAVTHQIAMRSADNAIQQAKEQQKEAFTNYFPQVSATGMGFRTNKDMLKTSINTSDILTPQTLQTLSSVLPATVLSQIPSTMDMSMLDKGIIAGIQAIQPVFMGGQIINGNKLAKVGMEASNLQKRTSRNQVLLTSEQYYWQIVTLKEKQHTLDAVSEMLRSLEKDATVAIKAGVAMRNDLLQVQLKQNEIESDKIKLQNGLELSRMVLAQYVGMEGADIDVEGAISSSQLPDYPASLKADPSAVVIVTPEYQLLQKNVEAKTLECKLEVGKNLPSVSIGAGYNYVDMLDSKNNFGMVFATVSVPVSSWWGGSHAIKRKQLAEQNAREQLVDNTQLLKIRMQKNWNDVDAAYKQLALAQKSIQQSEENLRLNRDYYHAGTVKMSDLLDAQQRYQQAHDSYVEAYAQLQTKIVEYRQSIGQ